MQAPPELWAADASAYRIEFVSAPLISIWFRTQPGGVCFNLEFSDKKWLEQSTAYRSMI